MSTGRSPLVVVRVSSSKPSAVVLHNLDPTKVDKLAHQDIGARAHPDDRDGHADREDKGRAEPDIKVA